jgi:hypothetical protein
MRKSGRVPLSGVMCLSITALNVHSCHTDHLTTTGDATVEDGLVSDPSFQEIPQGLVEDAVESEAVDGPDVVTSALGYEEGPTLSNLLNYPVLGVTSLSRRVFKEFWQLGCDSGLQHESEYSDSRCGCLGLFEILCSALILIG